MTLSAVTEGWTAEQRTRLLDWFDKSSRTGAAGMSFFGYIVSARDRFIAGLPPPTAHAFAERHRQAARRADGAADRSRGRGRSSASGSSTSWSTLVEKRRGAARLRERPPDVLRRQLLQLPPRRRRGLVRRARPHRRRRPVRRARPPAVDRRAEPRRFPTSTSRWCSRPTAGRSSAASPTFTATSMHRQHRHARPQEDRDRSAATRSTTSIRRTCR